MSYAEMIRAELGQAHLLHGRGTTLREHLAAKGQLCRCCGNPEAYCRCARRRRTSEKREVQR